MTTSKPFTPFAHKYRKSRVSGSFGDHITASDGTVTERVIAATKFCTKYGICLNTLKWHVHKGRIVVFKGRGRRWLVDMEHSQIPAFKRAKREIDHLGVKGRLRETQINSALDKETFIVTINGENCLFTGSKLVYEAIGKYLGVKPFVDFVMGPIKLPRGVMVKLACKLANGKKHYFSCHPDKLVSAMDDLIGKRIGNSPITSVWMGSKGHMV
jgi:hypothetical protein